jgi:protein-tyrosine phosphatase
MPRDSFTIQTVCRGNICRSPMAQAVLQQRLDDAALGAQARVASSGVSGEEDGNSIDPRAARALARRGYRVDRSHRAHRMTPAELADADLILSATFDQLRTLLGRGGRKDQVRLIREFDPAFAGRPVDARLDLEDPWWGTDSDFETALDQIEAAAPGVVEYVRERL